MTRTPIETSPVDKLEDLGRRLKKARKGFRQTKYDIYQETMENAVKMKSDGAALKAFVKRAGIDPKKLKSPNTSWITPAAFTFVTHNEQQGWKGARVAEFLIDFKKVPISKLSEHMRKLGGIEKIVKFAAKEDPRQIKHPGHIKKGGKALSVAKKNPFKSAKAHKESADADVERTEDWDTPGDDADQAGSEHSQIAIRISPALRAKLLAIESKRRVEMIGVRIDTDDWLDDVLEVQEVRGLSD